MTTLLESLTNKISRTDSTEDIYQSSLYDNISIKEVIITKMLKNSDYLYDFLRQNKSNDFVFVLPWHNWGTLVRPIKFNSKDFISLSYANNPFYSDSEDKVMEIPEINLMLNW
jgi:hypothetical protein